MRRQKLKKILSTTVTTVLVIMVVSVVTLNSYIYLNPEEPEIAQAIPTPTPDAVETPSPTPVSWIDTIFGTPTPTPTPTPGGDGDEVPTPTVRDSPSPTATIYVPPTPDEGGGETPTPPPPPTPDWSPPPPTPDWNTPPPQSECSWKDKLIIIGKIKSYTPAWKNAIRESEEAVVKKRYSSETGYPLVELKASLNFPLLGPHVDPSDDCKSATVTINYSWRVVTPEGGSKKYAGVPRSYRCDNNGGSWACR